MLTSSAKTAFGFTCSYLLVASALAWNSHNSEFLFYIAVMVVLLALVAIVHRRVRLLDATLWALSIWGFAHMVGGMVMVPEGWPTLGEPRVLYNLWIFPGWLKYDHCVHAYGFGITTWVCWQGLERILQTREHGVIRPTFGMALLCIAAGMGFGALNEVVEFAATMLVPNTNVGGYVNTGWDLVSNAFGATLSMVWVWVVRMRRES